MLNWKDVIMKQEQYKDLLRDAENSALIQQAMAGRERHNRLVWQAPATLARYLIMWGGYLIDRFAAIAGRLREPVGSPLERPACDEEC